MDNNFMVFMSHSVDPAFNLSVEEWLMNNSSIDHIILFLWQNENTVVIGRNQNPFKECDIKSLKEDSVHLVRRLSGGGAVYHDLGNLNFTFISSNDNYNVETNMKIILNSIAEFGLQGYFTGRNDLAIKERKFSGNAFFNDQGKSCHHGTLLVDVDFKKLSSYLTASPLKLKSKGIDSVSARVVNLKELAEDITVDKLKKALVKSFNEIYATEAAVVNLYENSADLALYMEKYRSLQWNFSESPDFEISFEEKFHWGIIEFCLNHSEGKIKECKIYTDAVLQVNFKELEKNLCGLPLEKAHIIEVLGSSVLDNQVKNDLIKLIEDKLCPI